MATFAFQQNRFIFVFAGLMLLAAAIWYGYTALDGAFLHERVGRGKVIGKEYVPFSEQYRMQNVGGINRAVKIAVPETWLLIVDLNGVRTKAGVEKSEFETRRPGEDVLVKYTKRRLSGTLRVTQYIGKGGG